MRRRILSLFVAVVLFAAVLPQTIFGASSNGLPNYFWDLDTLAEELGFRVREDYLSFEVPSGDSFEIVTAEPLSHGYSWYLSYGGKVSDSRVDLMTGPAPNLVTVSTEAFLAAIHELGFDDFPQESTAIPLWAFARGNDIDLSWDDNSGSGSLRKGGVTAYIVQETENTAKVTVDGYNPEQIFLYVKFPFSTAVKYFELRTVLEDLGFDFSPANPEWSDKIDLRGFASKYGFSFSFDTDTQTATLGKDGDTASVYQSYPDTLPYNISIWGSSNWGQGTLGLISDDVIYVRENDLISALTSLGFTLPAVNPPVVTNPDSGSSSGGGSSSGSPSSPPIVMEEAPVTPGGNSVSVPYYKSGQTAAVQLTETKVTDIIKKSKDGTAVLDLSGVEGITQMKMGRSDLSKFANAKLNIDVVMPLGKITFDPEAAKSIAALITDSWWSGLTVKLNTADLSKIPPGQKKDVKPGDLVYNVSISSSAKLVTGFDGKVTVSVPYTGKLPAPKTIWLQNDKNPNKLVKTECTYNEKTGEVTFAVK